MQWDMMIILFLSRHIVLLRTAWAFPYPVKDTTEYYIIPVNNTQKAWEAQENKFGAFSKKDFEVKRKELGVPDDITFKEL